MYLDTTFPRPDGRLAGLMRELNALGSTDIGAAIDAMIERLDAAAGDPDLEPNGDELDASALDGWLLPSTLDRHHVFQEDAEDDDSDRCAAGEDHMIGGPVANRDWSSLSHRIGDDDDAEYAGDEQDGNFAEDDHGATFPMIDGPGCPLADPGGTASPGHE